MLHVQKELDRSFSFPSRKATKTKLSTTRSPPGIFWIHFPSALPLRRSVVGRAIVVPLLGLVDRLGF